MQNASVPMFCNLKNLLSGVIMAKQLHCTRVYNVTRLLHLPHETAELLPELLD